MSNMMLMDAGASGAKGGMMDPVTGAALIQGGLSALGQVFGMNAQAAARKKQQELDAVQQGFATQSSANQQQQQGTQNAFQQMMEGYRSALS